MRLAPELKSKIDSLWDKFWSGGMSNPHQSPSEKKLVSSRFHPLKSPVRFPSPFHKNTPAKSFKFLYRDKAYIPVPREHEYVAKTTMNEKPLKRK